MPKKSAIEILVYKPGLPIPPDQRGIHENLWIKERFNQYLSIGVYLEGEALKYYFFQDCDKTPKIYNSLVELKQDLPNGLEDIFDNNPKLFMMGHGHSGFYGLCNINDPSEQIYDDNFDKIIIDFEAASPKSHSNISVTLEACSTDDRALAARQGQEKTFLERLSATHPHMTFCGTGPWDPADEETGYLASGGFPTLNVPITAMAGSVWKHGNSVIFHHGNYQLAVKKSIFSSTETAKELKVNTLEYAREILKSTSLDSNSKEQIIKSICNDRNILTIEDLKSVPGLPLGELEREKVLMFITKETQILEKEKSNYITRAQTILAKAKSGEEFSDRDILIIALGLKNRSVFEGHESLLDNIFANKALLELVMVACGKVLIAGPSNDSIIDLLLEKGVDINSTDKNGMTALHYTAQNFYNYRKEPLDLARKLLDSGANLEAEDTQGRTPCMLAIAHSRKGNVTGGENLLMLFKQKRTEATAISAPNSTRSLLSSNLGFFRKIEDKFLEEHRHESPQLQGEYDKRFGLVLK